MQTLRYKLKWKLEKILLLLFIFTLPIINEELVMEIGFTLYINYIFAVAAGAVFIAKRLKSKRFKFWGSPIDFWLLFFIMAILLSIFQSSFITDISKVPMSTAVSIFTKHPWLRSISQVAAVVFMSFIYYLIINIVDDKRTLKAVLITFILSSTLVCLYSLIDVIMYYSPDNSLLGRLSLPQAISPIVPRGMITASRGLRIRGLMIEPLMLGTYLISIIPVSISLMFGNYWVRRRWLFIVLSIQLGALFFTISRGAWLGLLGALSALIFLNRRAISSQVKMLLRKPCSILIIGLILLSFVLLATIMVPHLTSNFSDNNMFRRIKELTVGQFWTLSHIEELARLSHSGPTSLITGGQWSTMMRINDIVAGLLMFKDHPLMGIGWGNYIYHYLDYELQLMTWWWADEPVGVPTCNNLPASVLGESGLLGFVAFVGLIIGIIRSMVKALGKLNTGPWHFLLSGYLASFIGVMVCYQFLSTFYFSFVWAMMGIMMAARRLALQEAKQNP